MHRRMRLQRCPSWMDLQTVASGVREVMQGRFSGLAGVPLGDAPTLQRLAFPARLAGTREGAARKRVSARGLKIRWNERALNTLPRIYRRTIPALVTNMPSL